MTGTTSEISFPIQETIDIQHLILRIKNDFNLDVDIEVSYKSRPIKLRGRKALDVFVAVRGEKRLEYIARLEEGLDDYLEANGLFI